MLAPCRSELYSFKDVYRLGPEILVRIQIFGFNSLEPPYNARALLTWATCAIPSACPLYVKQNCRLSGMFTVWVKRDSSESKYWVSRHINPPQRPTFAALGHLRQTAGILTRCRSEVQILKDIHHLGPEILRGRARPFCGCMQFDHALQMTHLGHFGDLVAAPSHQVRFVTETPFLHDLAPYLENVSAMISCRGRPVPRRGFKIMQETRFRHTFWRSVATQPWPTQASPGLPRQLVRVVKSMRSERRPSNDAHAAFGGCVQFDHPLQMTHLGRFGDLVAAPSHQDGFVTETPFLHDVVPFLENASAMISCHGRPFPRHGLKSCRKHLFVMLSGDPSPLDRGRPRHPPGCHFFAFPFPFSVSSPPLRLCLTRPDIRSSGAQCTVSPNGGTREGRHVLNHHGPE